MPIQTVWVQGEELTALDADILHYNQTPAEDDAGATPTGYQYPVGRPVYDIRRYGASPSASAATNSAAIQAASDSAWAAGGGTVYVPVGEYDTDDPIIIYDNVSLVGDGKYASTLRKMTSTVSSVRDENNLGETTVRFYDSQDVDFPNCVVHFVNHDGVNNWGFAEVRDIGVRGNTTDPNTSIVDYGWFWRGMSGCRVVGLFAEYVKQGFFAGAGSSIVSEFTNNHARHCQRCFYQHFATSMLYADNYANNYRYAGHYILANYSTIENNACDNGGTTFKVGTTEICLAYDLHALYQCTVQGNGCEYHNGSVWKFYNCISTRFQNNAAYAATSSYTGGSDICLIETSDNIDCYYDGNKVWVAGMTGTAGRHFNRKHGAEYGTYEWTENNHFYNAFNATGPDTAWVNTSGEISPFVPQTLTGAGAVNLIAKATWLVTTGANALTLADGREGQLKLIIMKTDGGDGTLTPSNLANGTTLTFTAVDMFAKLEFTNGQWYMFGGNASLA